MSTKPIYQYTWKTGWTNKSSTVYQNSENDIKSDLKKGLTKAMLEKFAEKLAELGHWFIIDGINVNITSFSKILDMPYIPLPLAPCEVNAEGTTTVIFRSDATPDEHFSPQGWEELLIAFLAGLGAFIVAHGTAIFVLLFIIALIFYTREGGLKGTLFGAGGGGALGDIGIILIIGIIGILVLSPLLGKEKGKGRRR